MANRFESTNPPPNRIENSGQQRAAGVSSGDLINEKFPAIGFSAVNLIA
jgi:hypothetical protein